jgi:hypothetical protein
MIKELRKCSEKRKKARTKLGLESNLGPREFEPSVPITTIKSMLKFNLIISIM